MISVIVCSRQNPDWDFHQRNVQKTIGESCEYIRIDNSSAEMGICEAYNRGIDKAAGDILVFVHEDVFFMEEGWGKVLQSKFSADSSVGLIGVAGTQYLLADDLRWHIAGQPFLKGRVIHELDKGGRFILTVFSWDKTDAEVVAVDGLFFAVKKELFSRVRFDDNTFRGFHFYDLDVCMQIRQTHKCMVTWDILLKHLSAGKNDPSWHNAANLFAQKHQKELPVSCVDSVPVPGQRQGAFNYDLKDKVSQNTIV